MDDSAKLIVSVRIRPVSEKELSKDNVEIVARSVDEKTVLVVDPMEDWCDDVLRQNRPREKIYSFDQVFSESASQLHVYERTVRFLIPYVLKGYNSTVFAYGATGAGKTFTMLGTESNPGIMALTLADLFNKIERNSAENPQETFQVSLSYLEIYNENIRDLLSGKPDVLDLRDDGSKGTVVAGITSVTAHSAEEVMMFLKKGNRNRSQEATGANEVSSRSHAVLQVLITATTSDKSGSKIERFSKLSMIDLAGSERAAETNNRGQRMIEGANINRSLLALGNCINALGDGKRGKYVNYRDSKLTRLLKDSLGGNCRTVMITNISPASSKFDETLNTLKYASRARTIKNKLIQQINYKYDSYNNAISQMRAGSGSTKARIPNTLSNQGKDQTSTSKHSRTRTHTTDTMKSSTGKWLDAKRSAVSTAAFSEDSFNEHLDSLEIYMADQIGLKNRIIEEDESEAAAASTVEQLQLEIDNLTPALGHSDPQNQEKIKYIESQINSKKKSIKACEQTKAEIQEKKLSLESQILEINEKMKENRMSICTNMDTRGRQYIDLRFKSHFLEIENMDLALFFNLASNVLSQKEDESHIFYELIQLYEEIIEELLKRHPKPLATSLQNQFENLREQKANVEIIKIDDRSTERIRRKIQLNSLTERITQASQDKDAVSDITTHSSFSSPKSRPPVPQTPSSKNEPGSKKQNIFSAGLAKLLKKTSDKHLKMIEPVEKEEREPPNLAVETNDLHAYNINLANAKPIQVIDKKDVYEKLPPPQMNLFDTNKPDQKGVDESPLPLAESQFSKSLMMLEKQVETLTHEKSSASKIDYMAEFQARSKERIAKLSNSFTPYSERTLSDSKSSLLNDTVQYFFSLIIRDQAADNIISGNHVGTSTQKSNTVRTTIKTDSEKRVEEKRLLKNIGPHQKIDVVSKLHPILHKTTGRSRRNTSEKYF